MVKVIRRNLRYPKDYPTSPAEEKGIDVAIAVDLLHAALTDKDMDAAILFSSDTDLLPALELITRLRCAHIEVAAWARGNRLRFDGSQLPWCHSIGETEYRTLEDPIDYSAAPAVFPSILRPH